MKTLEAAPTLVTLGYGNDAKNSEVGAAHGDISVCQFTSTGYRLTCSQQRRYYGDITETGLNWGQKFKLRMDKRLYEKKNKLMTT